MTIIKKVVIIGVSHLVNGKFYLIHTHAHTQAHLPLTTLHLPTLRLPRLPPLTLLQLKTHNL
jgi:hypothetical protein